MFPLWAGLLLLGGLAHPIMGVATELSMHIEDGVVTVDAQDVPLQLFVEELAAKSGLRLVQHATLDEQVSLAAEYQSLNEALDEVLGEYSYQLFQAQASDGTSGVIRPVPGTLWVFSEGESHAPASTMFFEAVLYFGTLAEKNEAIRELKRLATSDAVQSLSLALHDAEPPVRDAALEALSSIGSDEALAAIASTTQDSNPWVRNEAINALSSGNADSAMQYLQMAMDDPDPRVRVSVVDALADIPSEHAASVISRALRDPDEQVRERALDALDEVQATIAFDALMKARGLKE